MLRQKSLSILLFYMAIFVALSVASQVKAAERDKKLIYYGWGSPDTMYVREHWKEMERMPFDGIGVTVPLDRLAWLKGKTYTTNNFSWNVFGPRRVSVGDLAPAIADLKVPQWQRFTDNFIPAVISSSGQDQRFSWFDDTRWRTIADNWKVLVTAAKESGSRGVLLDPENYRAGFFNYGEMNKREEKPFEDYVAKVRERGRQLMEVTRAAFPDITIICLYAYTLVWSDVRNRGRAPAKALETAPYGLYPAFLDGMLEAAAPETKIVDGFEQSYGFKRREQFIGARDLIKRTAIQLSAVPHRYAKHVDAGFGVWIDYMSNRKPWISEADKQNHFRPAELREALRAALEISDRYVWLYSETPRFFPPSNLPGEYLEAIGQAIAK